MPPAFSQPARTRSLNFSPAAPRTGEVPPSGSRPPPATCSATNASSTSSSRPLLVEVLSAFSSSHRVPLRTRFCSTSVASRYKARGGRELVVVELHDMEASRRRSRLCIWVATAASVRRRHVMATPRSSPGCPAVRFRKASKAWPLAVGAKPRRRFPVQDSPSGSGPLAMAISSCYCAGMCLSLGLA